MKNSIRRAAALTAAVLTLVFALAPVSAGADAGLCGIGQSQPAALGGVPAGANVTAEEWDVLRIVNHERVTNGAEPLTVFRTLQNAADIRAEEITQVMEHERPDGSSCFTVLGDVGLEYSYAGENIAAGYSNAESVMKAWMNSSGHRKNILTPDFVHIGIGRETAGTDYGIYWVQVFFEGFGCGYSGIDFILPSSMTFPVGTRIDDMGIIAVLHCDECGDCFLPVSSDFCKGFDPDTAALQHVSVSCCGVNGTFDVEIEGAAGDIDGSGRVTVEDALMGMRGAMGLLHLTPAQISAGDIDGDGRITVGDCVNIMRGAMGIG